MVLSIPSNFMLENKICKFKFFELIIGKHGKRRRITWCWPVDGVVDSSCFIGDPSLAGRLWGPTYCPLYTQACLCEFHITFLRVLFVCLPVFVNFYVWEFRTMFPWALSSGSPLEVCIVSGYSKLLVYLQLWHWVILNTTFFFSWHQCIHTFAHTHTNTQIMNSTALPHSSTLHPEGTRTVTPPSHPQARRVIWV